MASTIESIAHPTDFSDLSRKAFAHALRIAVAARSRLHLLHVGHGDAQGADTFPNVQSTLARWGLIEGQEGAAALSAKLGILVSNVAVDGLDPARGIVGFLDQHASDLVVLATHARDGVERLLRGSVAETVFRQSAVPTLFVSPTARGFVSDVSGDIALNRILIPIDHAPKPTRAVEAVRRFARAVTGLDVTVFFLHVGTSAPVLYSSARELEFPETVIVRSGNVVDAILSAADEFDVDLIGMPTAGHHGVFDALRGSTTERVVRHARCPILAVPAGAP